ncbi:MAG: hypothetical protein AB8H80_02935 [Planctomycetota bacterium]
MKPSGRAVGEGQFVVGAMISGRPRLPRQIAALVRAAAEWIGHPTIDAKGRRLDLHAMRKSFNVNLRRCGASKEARVDLMRHAAIGVTDEHYDDPDLEHMREAVNQIPAEAASVPGLPEFDDQNMHVISAPNTAPKHAPIAAVQRRSQGLLARQAQRPKSRV